MLDHHRLGRRERDLCKYLLDLLALLSMKSFGKENANELQVPYPFKFGAGNAGPTAKRDWPVAFRETVMQNELACTAKKRDWDYFANVWQTMRLYRLAG